MEENKNTDIIDLRQIAKKIRQQRKVFYKVWLITIVLSCIYIFSLPRYYTTNAKLVPEMESATSVNGLSSLASSFGFDINNMQTSDAITPMLYPDLMEDNGFVASLFSIRVKSADDKIDTDYYTYLKIHQKKAWWQSILSWIKNTFNSLLPKPEKITPHHQNGEIDPYWLSEEDDQRVEKIRSYITFKINEKNGVITVNAKAQDPLIARTLADSVQKHVQQFITDYRTNKARIDVEHYQLLAKSSYKEYEIASKKYAQYADASIKVVMPSHQTIIENLQKDIEVKYSTYTTLVAQLEVAKAKLQERTPAFTTLKAASVPIKPAGPKRMLFVLFMVVFATVTTGVVILREDLLKLIVISGTDKSK